MKRVSMILVASVAILSLLCISLVADEDSKEYTGVKQKKGPVEKDYDRSEHMGASCARLLAELESQREEIRALREEIRSLREGMLQLLAEQLNRQWEEMNTLREMQHHQYNFMQEMLNREFEIRLRQGMEGREREWNREREEGNIEMEIRRIQEAVEENPGDPELRLKLGYTYWEVQNIEAAYRQFKAALEIAPDFEPAYGALEKLRTEFPDVSRTPVEKPLNDSAGTVISANKEEIKLQVFEGDAVTFKVPFIQNEEGAWVLNEDFAHFAGSLEPGTRIRILWQEMEDRRVIRRIERIEDEE